VDALCVNNDPEFRAMNPLLIALDNQNADLVRTLLDHGALLDRDHLHEREIDRNPYLEAAVLWGNSSIVEELALMRTDFGCTLSIAVRKQDSVCVKYLLDCGADPNGCDTLHDTSYEYNRGSYVSPILEAVKNNDLPMINLLLEAGADPTNSNALRHAISSSPPVFEVLMNAMSKTYPNRRRSCVASALATAVSAGATVQIRRLLELHDNPCSPVIPTGPPRRHNHHKWSHAAPLAAAITKDDGGDLETVALLLESNLHLESPIVYDRCNYRNSGHRSETALLLAIGTKQSKMVQLLLDRGADVNSPATRGILRTPLQRAAELGCYNILQVLIDHGANVNGCPAVRGGATALQLAAIGGYIGTVELLLDFGADLLASGAKVDGRTALEGAAEHGRIDMVKYLADQRRHPYERLENAEQLAAENGHIAVVEFIQSLQRESRTRSIDSDLCIDCSAYSCDECGEKLSNASALRRHERTKHGNATDKKGFACERCGRGFGRKDTLDRHRATHAGSGQFPCVACGNIFRRQDTLSLHLKSCQR
jgi:ankyrin repeat protein